MQFDPLGPPIINYLAKCSMHPYYSIVSCLKHVSPQSSISCKFKTLSLNILEHKQLYGIHKTDSKD